MLWLKLIPSKQVHALHLPLPRFCAIPAQEWQAKLLPEVRYRKQDRKISRSLYTSIVVAHYAHFF